MNKGFGAGTIFVVDASHVEQRHQFIGKAVLVTLSNGNSFICGCEQEIYLGGEFIIADKLSGIKIHDDVFVESVKHIGETVLYDITVSDEDHIFNILVGDLFIPVHNIPSIIIKYDGPNLGAVTFYHLYRFMPINSVQNVIVYRDVYKARREVLLDVPLNIVQLGGQFEKVGEADEAIGGGNQKVGSDNQR